MRRFGLALAALLACLAPACLTVARADATFGFDRLVLDDAIGRAPRACLRFNDTLAAADAGTLRSAVTVSPQADVAISAVGRDLCLSGLDNVTQYHVQVAAGLHAAGGAVLEAPVAVDVTFQALPARVAIDSSGSILPRAASNGLSISTINVERLKIRVLRMSDRLAPTSDAALQESSFSPSSVAELVQSQAALVWSGTMDVKGTLNQTARTAFPLARAIDPARPGAYLVLAEDARDAIPDAQFGREHQGGYDRAWYQDGIAGRWVVSTDIALTALAGADGLHVLARSFASALPREGIEVSLLSVGSDVLATGRTDAAGALTLPPGASRGTGANAPARLVAYGAGGDFTLLDMTRASFDLSDRGVGGRPVASGNEAFLYSDRGIYRPGETMHVSALLRDRLGRAQAGAPLTLVLRRPDGVEARRLFLPAAPDGGFHPALDLHRDAPRGTWSIEAFVDPHAQAVGRLTVEVQDFVPQTLKVSLSDAGKPLQPGQALGMALQGDFLYGAPAAGLNGEGEIRLVRDPAPVPDAVGYQFGLAPRESAAQPEPQQVKIDGTDPKGRAVLDDVLAVPPDLDGPVKAVISAGLFEASGRLVQDTVERPVHIGSRLIGLQPQFADGRVNEGQAAGFAVRAFDVDGAHVAAPGLRWRLVREARQYDWVSLDDRWTWHYRTYDEPVSDGTLDVAADRPSRLAPQVDWGDYRLIVEDPAHQAATSVRFTAGWGNGSTDAERPDQLRVTADRRSYAPGDVAHVHVETPFAGHGALVVASDRVFETREIDLPKGAADLDVTVGQAWGPGAYVLVAGYRPLAPAAPSRDPARAIGVAWLGIDAAPRTLAVAMTPPAELRPNSDLVVPIHVTGAAAGARVTVAAVDEGILQLTRFQTPDPAAFLFGKRALGVGVRDDYGRLLDGSTLAGTIREGGDAGIGGVGLPVIPNRIVSLFSGPVTLDADGRAVVRFAVPDFAGRLRLMAVASAPDAVGAGEAAVVVRDPVVADLALPRFLAPGDRARVALTLDNVAGAAGDYVATLSTDGPVRVAGAAGTTVTLAQGQRSVDRVALEATGEGVAMVRMEVHGPGLEVRHEWPIAVRGAHEPVVLASSGVQADGEIYAPARNSLAGMVPGGASLGVGYSTAFGIDPPSLLQSLYRYPYGCTEQLTSGAWPLIYFKDPALLGAVPRDEATGKRVQDAIDSILDRQGNDGAFGLWRLGDGLASAWLDAYALDFLSRARQSGFDVPDAALAHGLGWLERRLRGTQEEEDGAYAQSDSATRAYAHYVLARAGRGDLLGVRRTLAAFGTRQDGPGVSWASAGDGAKREQASPLALGQLAGAFSLLGDAATARSVMDLAVRALDNRSPPRWWWYRTYYSPVRDVAGLIAIAAETKDTERAATLLDRLRQSSRPLAELNTQDKAWLLAAAQALNGSPLQGQLLVGGQALDVRAQPVELAPSPAEVAAGYAITNRTGRSLWRTTRIEGTPSAAPAALQRGYTIEASYFTADGRQVDPTRLLLNDRVVVVLHGTVTDRSMARRTILVDRIPAGWDIEATVKDPETFGFVGSLSKVSTIQARDDRFVAAIDLGHDRAGFGFREVDDDAASKDRPPLDEDEFRVAFVVRVTVPGTFALPEAVVSDMYAPQVMARTAGQVARVGE